MSTENTDTAAQERRVSRRHLLKKGVAITVRKGTMGLGPNVAINGVEISEDGIQVRVKCEFKSGEEIEIGLTGVGRSKPMMTIADVCWCRVDGENSSVYLVGAQFRRRIAYPDLINFI